MDDDTSVHTAIPLDNSGRGPLQVPGFRGIPVHYELKLEDRFAHGEREWRQAPAVTARELAMVAVMNKLTDKPEWYVDIFNDQVVAKWREEAFEMTPLMSEKAWSWCLDELRDKAVYFREKQHVRVLDTGSCVCKSDMLALQLLAASFRSTATPLLDQQQNKDWQPGSDNQVLNLVDPSLFPLVYGRSLVLADGGQVDLQDMFSSYKDATVAPKHFDRRIDSRKIQRQIDENRILSMGVFVDNHDSKSEFYRWSSNYQCLPCDVEFLKETGTEVHLTSYINNLHPAHKPLYQNIEKLISLSIKLWNDCLVQGQRGLDDYWNQGQLGPIPLRIITYGIEWENELPQWALAFNVPHTWRKWMYREAQEVLQSSTKEQTDEDKEKQLWAQQRLESLCDVAGKENMEMPPPDSDLWQRAKEYLELPENGSTTPVAAPEDWADGECQPWDSIICKQARLIRFKHPEPGTTFSYEDWKAGSNNNKAIIDIVSERSDWGGHFKPVVPDYKPYKINLQDTFRKQGLQVIVKIDSIELTPDNPTYSSGSWQLPGQLNEHIVAVAVFPYDVQNITEPRISFRQETPIHECSYRYAEERFTGESTDIRNRPVHRYGKSSGTEIDALAAILGFPALHLLRDYYGVRAFQGTGSVATPQGRLITFPNVMEHRVEAFELADPSIPGHYRSVKLYLVDPHYRVCSTRNVPPQQHHWWAQAVGNEFAKTGLPQEIIDEIIQETEDWPMGMQEAREHRLELIKEHRWNELVRIGTMPRYTFY